MLSFLYNKLSKQLNNDLKIHFKLSLWTMYKLTNISEFKERGPQLKLLPKHKAQRANTAVPLKCTSCSFGFHQLCSSSSLGYLAKCVKVLVIITHSRQEN